MVRSFESVTQTLVSRLGWLSRCLVSVGVLVALIVSEVLCTEVLCTEVLCTEVLCTEILCKKRLAEVLMYAPPHAEHSSFQLSTVLTVHTCVTSENISSISVFQVTILYLQCKSTA
ncbi:hypothetical protein VOLCADRAFT_93383 [Volvox carteri f. nagariensis]|uniref:Uncharacterized protein n=1 Tax=Volvox carteri f. nagariensis TaxID=3068 RepID=D8U1Z6_VOLCA|nr:uncharacterized protein VOLCADRAFT_93383 [Volvox carteri f. nagariensis]EFJ46272.1 hypothetical protein VOLCADRAFT_93383 [Volvox carteri f. nagariensis]|eukprot:XP_002952719.1 hypothetical protein VOLCADRAFT_93383 [Volvox carteri f. nagariensis]